MSARNSSSCGTLLAALLILGAGAVAQARGAEVLSLAGSWRFGMGGSAPGEMQGAPPAQLKLNDTIDRPGTTETRRTGPEHGPGGPGQLTRRRRFDGPAWYQRDVTIPQTWRGKRVTLLLERTKYSQVWLDEKPVGESPILCTAQEYELGQVDPGDHRLTIVVDNTRKLVPGENHQTSDNTQGNWNGVLGRIELRATDLVWLDDVRVSPDASKRAVLVRVRLGNSSNESGGGSRR